MDVANAVYAVFSCSACNSCKCGCSGSLVSCGSSRSGCSTPSSMYACVHVCMCMHMYEYVVHVVVYAVA